MGTGAIPCRLASARVILPFPLSSQSLRASGRPSSGPGGWGGVRSSGPTASNGVVGQRARTSSRALASRASMLSPPPPPDPHHAVREPAPILPEHPFGGVVRPLDSPVQGRAGQGEVHQVPGERQACFGTRPAETRRDVPDLQVEGLRRGLDPSACLPAWVWASDPRVGQERPMTDEATPTTGWRLSRTLPPCRRSDQEGPLDSAWWDNLRVPRSRDRRARAAPERTRPGCAARHR